MSKRKSQRLADLDFDSGKLNGASHSVGFLGVEPPRLGLSPIGNAIAGIAGFIGRFVALFKR